MNFIETVEQFYKEILGNRFGKQEIIERSKLKFAKERSVKETEAVNKIAIGKISQKGWIGNEIYLVNTDVSAGYSVTVEMVAVTGENTFTSTKTVFNPPGASIYLGCNHITNNPPTEIYWSVHEERTV